MLQRNVHSMMGFTFSPITDIECYQTSPLKGNPLPLLDSLGGHLPQKSAQKIILTPIHPDCRQNSQKLVPLPHCIGMTEYLLNNLIKVLAFLAYLIDKSAIDKTVISGVVQFYDLCSMTSNHRIINWVYIFQAIKLNSA